MDIPEHNDKPKKYVTILILSPFFFQKQVILHSMQFILILPIHCIIMCNITTLVVAGRGRVNIAKLQLFHNLRPFCSHNTSLAGLIILIFLHRRKWNAFHSRRESSFYPFHLPSKHLLELLWQVLILLYCFTFIKKWNTLEPWEDLTSCQQALNELPA